MGGAVSSGRNNDELIDNLMGSSYIRTRGVELAFRAVDRGDYILPEFRDQAYKDLAWRSGSLHLSAPCIYSEVMEGLELRPGLSFLNVGSGTGYLSTLAGLILGSGGINHGVEISPSVVDYANTKLKSFVENSLVLDEFEFCEPKFFVGNGLSLAPLQAAYDRVYCGAACPEKYANYFKQLIKVGGVLVMPLNDNLLQVRRESQVLYSSKVLLNVTFVTLRVPSEDNELFKLEELCPPRLQSLARSCIRSAVRGAALAACPDLVPPTHTPKPTKPRRICIPIENDSDAEELNTLHDLDRESGGNEMNALLSLVLSMGQNHAQLAGSIRFDSPDVSDSDSDDSIREEIQASAEGLAADIAEAAAARAEAAARTGGGADAEPPARVPVNEDDVAMVENLLSSTLRRAITGRGPRAGAVGRVAVSLHVERPRPAAPPPPAPRSPPPPRRRRDRKRHSDSSLEHASSGEEAGASAVPAAAAAEPGSSSDVDPAAAAAEAGGAGEALAKRQKFDSGLGEDAPPSTEASPHTPAPASDTDDMLDTVSDTASYCSDSETENVYVVDGRRSALSARVSAGLRALPLPPPLRRYVALNRTLV